MPTLGNTPRPAYVYDTETDTWVPVGVGAHTHSDIPNTLVDAKGDLITATADNVPARLAKGADGTILVSDSSTSTGLAWQPYASQNIAGKNFLINGNFDIWQRGTSFNTYSIYTADRWYNMQSASITCTRQSTNPPVGSQYVFRQTATAGGGYLSLHQYIETSTVATLWGKTVTFSIKLRRSATFDSVMFVDIQKTPTVDGGSGATWTQIATTQIPASSISSGTTSSDWTTLSVTATIPSDGTANGLYVRLGYLTNPANGSYIEAAQAQLEIGSLVTPFSRAAGTYQAELAACQRYYYRWTSGATYARYPTLGVASSTTIGSFPAAIPVTMRITPYSVEYGGNFRLYDMVNTPLNMTSIALFGSTELSPTGWINIIVASGLTQLRTYSLNSRDDVNAYIGLNAEL